MMIVGRPIRHLATELGGHYCPHCLRRVPVAEATRQAHREDCRSGALDVSLLRCPICGLVLSAEVERGDLPGYAFRTPNVRT